MSTKDPEYKRPDHNDFCSSYELKQKQFSGTRNNVLSGYLEIWVLGEKRAEVIATAPDWLIEQTFAEVFALEAASMKGRE